MKPITRGLATLAGIAAALACADPASLATAWLGILIPLLAWCRILRMHLRFVVAILLPVATALVLVWGWVVGAAPGQPPHSSPEEGLRFAALVALRLAAIGGIWQLCFVTLSPRSLVSTLYSWGIRGQGLVLTLGTVSILPELPLRARQVLDARYARGLASGHGWAPGARQFIAVLPPLMTWVLRSAIQRAEVWQHRQLVERVEAAAREPDVDRGEFCEALPNGLEPMTANGLARAVSTSAFLDARAGELIALRGDNFSGRTRLLRQLAGLDGPVIRVNGRAYVSPEIYNSLSGLAPTVADELALHSVTSRIEVPVRELARELGLTPLLERNPFSLSGGEQALVVLAAVFAYEPATLALDCCLEQLDSDLRARVISRLVHGLGRTAGVAFADNRLDEYPIIPAREIGLPAGSVPDEGHSPRLGLVSADRVPDAVHRGAELDINAIEFRYPGARSPVLRGVSLTLQPMRPYLLEGRNGSGKSTLAKILCGALRPIKGELRLGGEPLHPWRRPGRAVGYHFQNPDLQLFSTRVAQEIEVGIQMRNRAAAELHAWTRAWMVAFGLEEAADAHPLDLPFVGRKRVALAATFAMGTPWLILDEPTLGQDGATMEALAEMVRKHVDAGGGAMIVTHSRKFAGLIQGQRLLLDEGVIRELC